MTVREVYEKAQGVEANIALLRRLETIITEPGSVSDMMCNLHEFDLGFLRKTYEFLQEYADRLYDTGSYIQ